MVRFQKALIALGAVGAIVLLLSASGGCGSNNAGIGGSGFGDDGGPGSSSSGASSSSSSGSGSSGAGSSGGAIFSSPGGDASAPCMGGGLHCYVPPNCDTTITGTVYDPAGINPLYNVVVFVPNDPMGALTPIKQGTNTCSSCDVSIGDYVTATTSKYDGTFELRGVPATTHVPLVVQIGKWRREVFLSQVKSCTNNVLQGSSLTRLPRNHKEGDIPQMALVTGGADNLGCFLQDIGLDQAEYSAPHAGGRLDIYQGLPAGANVLGANLGGAPKLSTGTAGDCTTDNPNCVWNSKANFEKYDIVLLSCEGNPYDPDDPDSNNPTNKTASAKTALHDWLDEGGKVFATHFHYTWFKNSPDPAFKAVATWLGRSGASGSGQYTIDTSFPKGMVLDQWLDYVKAATGTSISLSSVAQSVSTVNKTTTTQWIFDPSNQDVKYLSFTTPIGGIPIKASDAGSEMTAQYCGKAVFTDLHVGGSPQGDIPGACTGTINSDAKTTAQLEALEFLFFDLSACVSSDSLPPPNVPPPAK